uniref:Uncharacterized protein n=1 Tax=Bos taurus TaxID=9913 RepID=A0A3Q1LV90_BOVIN
MKTPLAKTASGQRSRTGSGHASVSVIMMKRKAAHKKHRSRPISHPPRNIVGCRIRHGWKDGDEPQREWKRTILDQKFTGHRVKTTGTERPHTAEDETRKILSPCILCLFFPFAVTKSLLR